MSMPRACGAAAPSSPPRFPTGTGSATRRSSTARPSIFVNVPNCTRKAVGAGSIRTRRPTRPIRSAASARRAASGSDSARAAKGAGTSGPFLLRRSARFGADRAVERRRDEEGAVGFACEGGLPPFRRLLRIQAREDLCFETRESYRLVLSGDCDQLREESAAGKPGRAEPAVEDGIGAAVLRHGADIAGLVYLGA